MDITTSTSNEKVLLLNKVEDFRIKNNMQDMCWLDVLEEYSFKYDIPLEFLAQELAEIKGFRELIENDLEKHKYIRGIKKFDSMDIWENI